MEENESQLRWKSIYRWKWKVLSSEFFSSVQHYSLSRLSLFSEKIITSAISFSVIRYLHIIKWSFASSSHWVLIHQVCSSWLLMMSIHHVVDQWRYRGLLILTKMQWKFSLLRSTAGTAFAAKAQTCEFRSHWNNCNTRCNVSCAEKQFPWHQLRN